jgi:hypothetical protein
VWGGWMREKGEKGEETKAEKEVISKKQDFELFFSQQTLR